jgi:hypothetical protein
MINLAMVNRALSERASTALSIRGLVGCAKSKPTIETSFER